MTDLRTCAQTIVAETMQGHHSVEAMIDIVYRHMVLITDEQFKAGYGLAIEQYGYAKKKKAR